MFGLFVAFGSISSKITEDCFRNIWVPDYRMNLSSNDADFSMARFVPANHPEQPVFHSSEDHNFQMVMDGYVITKTAQNISGFHPQADSLMECFRRKGVREGLSDIVSGSYVMTVVDRMARKA
jgi:hypothetical protein